MAPPPLGRLVHPWWPALSCSPCFLSPLSHPLLSLLSSLSPVSLHLPVSLCLSGSHFLHLPLSLPLLVCFDPAHPLVSLPVSLVLSFSLSLNASQSLCLFLAFSLPSCIRQGCSTHLRGCDPPPPHPSTPFLTHVHPQTPMDTWSPYLMAPHSSHLPCDSAPSYLGRMKFPLDQL